MDDSAAMKITITQANESAGRDHYVLRAVHEAPETRGRSRGGYIAVVASDPVGFDGRLQAPRARTAGMRTSS